jgi:hypothetical protein
MRNACPLAAIAQAGSPLTQYRLEMRRQAMPDRHLENVGEHTQKKLPMLTWKRLANADRPGKTLLGLFFGTLIILAVIFSVAHLVRG